MSNDTLSLTGNSYLNSSLSVSKDSSAVFDEAALYLEDERTRYKFGRQNITGNVTSSTPSMSYSFMNSVNFDGVSLGYLSDYYRDRAGGASSPVNIYMPLRVPLKYIGREDCLICNSCRADYSR
ncbi:hypothetical protein [Budvicia aquatica]|uniref:Uncharacterized protein n=1 Tax=Budvicia aquatica TaxID=82979 RepID=A0A484ZA60_9GAMM|nr:hypothetical protein [Budvicia aquatica]VFS45297.1 Uncharacterised protein [Budvicia aquatica]